MGSRVGSAVGAVMDTKNKVRDSASSLKENVKDLPTQAGYAVHSAKQKAKDNVSDFIFRIHYSTYRRTNTASHGNLIIPLWSGWRIFMFRTRVIISRTSDCTSTSSDHTSCTHSPCKSAFHTSCPVSHKHHRSTEYPATYLLAVIGIFDFQYVLQHLHGLPVLHGGIFADNLFCRNLHEARRTNEYVQS